MQIFCAWFRYYLANNQPVHDHDKPPHDARLQLISSRLGNCRQHSSLARRAQKTQIQHFLLYDDSRCLQHASVSGLAA